MQKIEMVKLSLEKGAKIEARDREGRTPLLLSVLGKDSDTMNLLLDHGADIEAKDNDGRTALVLAGMYGKVGMVRLLRQRGADSGLTTRVDVRCSGRLATATSRRSSRHWKKGADIEADDDGTPLLWAVRNCKSEAVKLLLENGANIEAQATRLYRAGPRHPHRENRDRKVGCWKRREY